MSTNSNFNSMTMEQRGLLAEMENMEAKEIILALKKYKKDTPTHNAIKTLAKEKCDKQTKLIVKDPGFMQRQLAMAGLRTLEPEQMNRLYCGTVWPEMSFAEVEKKKQAARAAAQNERYADAAFTTGSSHSSSGSHGSYANAAAAKEARQNEQGLRSRIYSDEVATHHGSQEGWRGDGGKHRKRTRKSRKSKKMTRRRR